MASLETAVDFLGPVAPLVRPAWRYALRKSGHSEEPLLTFEPVPYTAAEPEIDIAKIQVRNVGYPRARATRTAERARLRCTVDSAATDLMCDDPLGPQLQVDLFERESRSVPVAIRGSTMVKFRGALLLAGTCYLMDPTLQTQQAPGPVLDSGAHTIDVTCHYGARERERRRFLLFVPKDLSRRLVMSRV